MLAAGTPIGKYVVRRKIGEGGMAEIYLCSSRGPEGFEKDVAIKRIRSYLATDQSFVQMFIAEARLASRLNHANLVQIFDFDKHEDTYYLAMELVRGHSLWDVRRRSKELMAPMPPTMVAQIGAEVAKGLWHAHRLSDKGKPLNLVHRDVTPHNVLLSFDGAVKLTDFGVAKHSASSTAAGVLKGKLAYMSPEQSRGEPLDARTDLFALGIVLWEMLTGGRLFDGDSDVAVLRAVQSTAIAPPSRVNPDVPEALSAVVMKALERDLSLRFQTAQEMERALAGFVLSHARSVDDTDLAGYLRTLYAEELAQDAAREGMRSGPSTPQLEQAQEHPRAPTRAMRAGEADPASPDEDMHASTAPVEKEYPRTKTWSTPVQAQPQAAPAEPPAPPKVIADLSALGPIPPPPPRASGPKPASPVPPPTMALPAVRRPTRQLAGIRRAITGALLLALGGAAAALTVALVRPAASPAGDTAGGEPSLSSPGAPSPATEPAPGPAQATSTGGPAASSLPPAAPQPPAEPTPGPAPDAPPGDLPGVPTAATTPAPQPSSRTRGAASLGTLVVRVRPYASVIIDGRRRKEAQGSATFRLPPGVHQVRLEHPRGTREEQVTIVSGEETVVEHSFVAR